MLSVNLNFYSTGLDKKGWDEIAKPIRYNFYLKEIRLYLGNCNNLKTTIKVEEILKNSNDLRCLEIWIENKDCQIDILNQDSTRKYYTSILLEYLSLNFSNYSLLKYENFQSLNPSLQSFQSLKHLELAFETEHGGHLDPFLESLPALKNLTCLILHIKFIIGPVKFWKKLFDLLKNFALLKVIKLCAVDYTENIMQTFKAASSKLTNLIALRLDLQNSEPQNPPVGFLIDALSNLRSLEKLRLNFASIDERTCSELQRWRATYPQLDILIQSKDEL